MALPVSSLCPENKNVVFTLAIVVVMGLINVASSAGVTSVDSFISFDQVKDFWKKSNCIFPSRDMYEKTTDNKFPPVDICGMPEVWKSENLYGRMCSEFVKMSISFCNKSSSNWQLSNAYLKTDQINKLKSENAYFKSDHLCDVIAHLPDQVKHIAPTLTKALSQENCKKVYQSRFGPFIQLQTAALCQLSGEGTCTPPSQASGSGLPNLPALTKEGGKVDTIHPESSGHGKDGNADVPGAPKTAAPGDNKDSIVSDKTKNETAPISSETGGALSEENNKDKEEKKITSDGYNSAPAMTKEVQSEGKNASLIQNSDNMNTEETSGEKKTSKEEVDSSNAKLTDTANPGKDSVVQDVGNQSTPKPTTAQSVTKKNFTFTLTTGAPSLIMTTLSKKNIFTNPNDSKKQGLGNTQPVVKDDGEQKAPADNEDDFERYRNLYGRKPNETLKDAGKDRELPGPVGTGTGTRPGQTEDSEEKDKTPTRDGDGEEFKKMWNAANINNLPKDNDSEGEEPTQFKGPEIKPELNEKTGEFDFQDSIPIQPKGSDQTYGTQTRGNKELIMPIDNSEAPGSGHFFAYFLTAVVICISGYVIFHNKQKIIAFVVEGRSDSRAGTRRRSASSNVKYSQLNSNVEEVMPSLDSSASPKNIAY